jgi:ribulose-5-phosphate 4-epimerase/fuculose-1-phosphate aldolase
MNRISPLHRKPLRTSISEAEWTARVDLAAAYRLADLYGMSDMIYTHISARVPGEPNHFLINAHGMLFDEITATSLLKVDLDGTIAYQPNNGYGLQVAGFVIHSALYRARPDVNAAMHTHTVAGMAVSSMKCGLIPLTQTSTRFYTRIAYHDFNGPERDPSERDHLARDLGSYNLMILRNHGLLTVGPSVAEAFNFMYGMERSCEAQLAAMSANTELNYLPQEVVDKAVAMYEPGVIRPYGVLEWPALLRKLDRLDPSYRD